MMKPIALFVLTFILVFVFAGCTLPGKTIQPTQVRSSLSPTGIPPTSTPVSTAAPTITLTRTIIAPTLTLTPSATQTLIPSATLTLTPTPMDTLEPAKVDEVILGFFRDPGDCLAPCFWGITPGQTTRDEANRILFHLGMSPYNTTIDGKDHANYEYQLKSGLSIDLTLTLQDNIVENQLIQMKYLSSNAKTASGWMAYSPKAIIQRYGKPSQVDFSWTLMEKPTLYIYLYFDEYDLISKFHSLDGPEPSSPMVCPLAMRYDYVWIWMGKNPYIPPGRGVRLDEGTSLNTIDEFVNRMTGDADHSCFALKLDAFLPH